MTDERFSWSSRSPLVVRNGTAWSSCTHGLYEPPHIIAKMPDGTEWRINAEQTSAIKFFQTMDEETTIEDAPEKLVEGD